ncbi:MAG: hypothetical protein IPK15_05770 [Verrucomicrobia bacterium]|nr:hypothetical protein [Verrucomicrobiota bacterium]
MKEKSNIWLAVALMLLLALTRWPGLLPSNFSAVYAMAFCTGLYFRGRYEWLLPLGTMVLSDVVLTVHYQKQSPDFDLFNSTTLLYMAGNYAGYIALFLLGRKLKAQSRFATLLGGGVLGAIVFYLVTNTAAWFLNPFKNPEYTKTFVGWLIALTKGTAGYAQTWEFFRNTLLSGGLFTGLFVGAMKLTSSSESSEKEAPEPREKTDDAPETFHAGGSQGLVLSPASTSNTPHEDRPDLRHPRLS